VQIFSVKHFQFIVKNTFKATCFDSTKPSSGLFIRTDPYPITSAFGITSVYNDGIYAGESKHKDKIHLTAVIEVNVSNFTYYFST
jgi:hypothetical protein